MDNDNDKQKQQEESCDSSSDGGDLPEPVRLRRFIQNGIGYDRVLLVYNWYFLPCLSVIFWTVFLAFR